MSWLGDRFTTLTSQLSTLTNEVLLEGREEADDRAAELQLSQQRIKELERQNGALRREVDQLRTTNVELEEQQHASELRLAHCRRELRLKEEEIQRLLRQDLDDFRSRLHGDGDFDSSDLAACQREIRRLSAVVGRLRANGADERCLLPQTGCEGGQGIRPEFQQLNGSAHGDNGSEALCYNGTLELDGVAESQRRALPQSSELEALQEENRRLEKSLVELDRQNQEAMSQLLTIKERLSSENKSQARKISELEQELKAALVQNAEPAASGSEKDGGDAAKDTREIGVQTIHQEQERTDSAVQADVPHGFTDLSAEDCTENQKDASTEKGYKDFRQCKSEEAAVQEEKVQVLQLQELETCREDLRVEMERTRQLQCELEQAKAKASELSVELRVFKENMQAERKQEAEGSAEKENERVNRLEGQLRTLRSEKEQILSVMNEKSRESSSLKAEVHHLMAVVTQERQAMAKLRAETIELRRGGGKTDGEEGKDLAREALHKLSQLVRDREVELDAQKQKVATLLQLLQQASPVTGDQMQELLEEREGLACQVAALQTQRDADKQQADSAREELHSLAERLQQESLRMQELQLQHDSARLQAEDRHKALRNAQNETVALKQRVADLENRCAALMEECRLLREAQVATREESLRIQVELEKLKNEKETKIEEARRSSDECAEQRREENQTLLTQVEKLQEKDEKQTKELERLRNHLLHVEESYTKEALQAEQREKDLRARILQLEDWAHASSSAVHAASTQANQQVDSLQQQLSRVTAQRDAAVENVSSLEDRLQEHAAALANLQMVLEQFQKEKDRELQVMQEEHDSELALVRERMKDLTGLVRTKEEQLSQTTDALEAAARLSEQLDIKEEAINSLREEVRKKEEELAHAREETSVVRTTTEGKVDKQVMKSLVLGYFSTPPEQRLEVVRLLARILDFSREEMEKAGIYFGSSNNQQVSTGRGGWISGLLWRNRSPSGSESIPRPLNRQSFSALFIKFLEEESRPQHGVRLPVEAMSQPNVGPSRALMPPPTKNLSTPSISPQFTSPLLLSPGDSHAHPLLQPIALPTFATVTENQSAFLQQMLK